MDAQRTKGGWSAQYLAELVTQRMLSPHTLDAYRRDLAQLATLTGPSEWHAVSNAEIRRCTTKLHAGGLSARSIARKLSAWRTFFDWLARHSSLTVNPVNGVRAPRRAKTLPKALGVDDAVHLVSGPPHPASERTIAQLCDQAMFELMYSSGLRVSELIGLDLHYARDALGWVDPDAREVQVTGKGNKQRRVPVGTHALAALAAWLAVRPSAKDDDSALFLSARGARMSARVVQLRLKAHALAVGTPADVHPHMLRHSFASHLLQSSGDLRAVQDMLGHASIASTQVYTSLDFQHLAKVYDTAHPRAKIK